MTPNVSPINSPNSLRINNPATPPFRTLLEQVKNNLPSPEIAFPFLSALFKTDTTDATPIELSTINEYVVKLLPTIIAQPNWIATLQLWLDRTRYNAPLQYTLACKLARNFKSTAEDLNSYRVPLYYYMKAVQLDPQSDDPLTEASSLFSGFVAHQFQEQLDNLRRHGNYDEFRLMLDRLDVISSFMTTNEDLTWLCKNVLTVVNACSPQFGNNLSVPVIHQLKQTFIPTQPISRRYREALGNLRKEMSDHRLMFEKWKQFICDVLLKDCFLILGLPPCSYDLRVMGSLGSKTPCLQSDIEYFILIKDDAYRPYFVTLAKLFELQTLLLGETAEKEVPIFTALCVLNNSGFHVDSAGNPANDPGALIRTPEQMAAHQRNFSPTGDTLAITVLKSCSISSNDVALNEIYYQALSPLLDEPRLGTPQRKTQALHILKGRYLAYTKQWHSPFNEQIRSVHLKNQFTALLDYLISDLGLYYGIRETNSLEIIQELVRKEKFSKRSGKLLQEVVIAVYSTRIDLHTRYGHQNEEASCPGIIVPGLLPLTDQQFASLERVYWLVLKPLYRCFRAIMDQDSSLDTVFQEIDLIQITFEDTQGLSSATRQHLVYQIALYLTGVGASDDEHKVLYQQLSALKEEEGDILRKSYVEGMEKGGAQQNLIDKIALIPTRSGLRQFALIKESELQHLILAKVTCSEVTPVRVIAPFLTSQRYLRPGVVEMDAEGNIKKHYSDTAHNVSPALDGVLHFKQKPTHPLMEYAVYNLASRLAGDLTPATELVRFEVNGRVYPVLISKTVDGKTLRSALTEHPKIDRQQWTWHLLLSLLICPGDGRLSNYILNNHFPGRIYGIDNDFSFLRPIVKGSFFGKAKINFHSTLFCMNMELDPEVLKDFCRLDIDAILLSWINDVITKEHMYSTLFSEAERDELFRKKPNEGFTPTILFRKGALATLNLQFRHLQTSLNAHMNTIRKPSDLLKLLIHIEDDWTIVPIGGHISEVYSKETVTSLSSSLSQEKPGYIEKSRTSADYFENALGMIPLPDMITANHFSPLAAKEEFFTTMLSSGGNFVYAKGGDEVSLCKDFKLLQSDPIRQQLVLAAIATRVCESVTKIALTSTTVLTSSHLSDFLHPSLKDLDLRRCPLVGNTALRLLEEKCSRLEKLLISGSNNLTSIDSRFFGEKLRFPSLVEFSVTRCTNLKKIAMHMPVLKKLKIAHNTALDTVTIEAPEGFSADLRDNGSAQWFENALDYYKEETDYVRSQLIKLNPTTKIRSIRRDENEDSIVEKKPIQPATFESTSYRGENISWSFCFKAISKDGFITLDPNMQLLSMWKINNKKASSHWIDACQRGLEGQRSLGCAAAVLHDGCFAAPDFHEFKGVLIYDCRKEFGRQSHNSKNYSHISTPSNVHVMAAFNLSNFLLVDDQDKVILLNVDTKETVQTFRTTLPRLNCLALSPDDTRFACTDGSKIEIWDIKTGTGKSLYEADRVVNMVFASNRTLVYATHNTLNIFDIENEEYRYLIEGSFSRWIALSMHPKGQLLACGFDKKIKIMDVSTGEWLHVIDGYFRDTSSLTFLHDGTLVSGFKHNSIAVFDNWRL